MTTTNCSAAKRINKLLAATENYDDSLEVAAMLMETADQSGDQAQYPLLEAATHIRGLWEHTKRLHRELEKTNASTPEKPLRMIKLPELRKLTTLSTSEIYRRIEAGRFPRQVRLGAKSSAWVESEVLAWLEGFIEERRA